MRATIHLDAVALTKSHRAAVSIIARVRVGTEYCLLLG